MPRAKLAQQAKTAKSPEVINRIIAVADCSPHERNYQKHSANQIADLRESLRQFGQVRSIVVQAHAHDARYTLVAGHGIWQAAQAEGLTHLRTDVIPAAWTKTRVLAYLAADNELARRGDPDSEQLAQIVKEIADAEGETLAKLAAGDANALRMLLAQANGGEETTDVGELIDKAEEWQKKWKVKRGDLWEIPSKSVVGRAHRILCGDSTESETVARLFGKERARLVWTDPPYGVNYGKKIAAANPIMHRVRGIQNDDLNDEELERLINSALANAAKNSIAGAAIYVAAPPGQPLPTLIRSFAGSGFEFHWHLVWLKDRMVLGRGDYHFKHENILYGWKPDGAHYFTDDRTQTSVFEYPRPTVSDEHPTMKPPPLIAQMIRNSTEFGDIVLDVFCGSGSTLVACEQTGRIGRGMEIAEKYVSVCLERLEKLGLEPKRVERAKA